MSYNPYQGGYPSGQGYPQGGMPQPNTAPSGLPYPAQPFPNPSQYPASYPPAPASYPPQAAPYPSQTGMPIPNQSPYPSEAPYPSSQAPYPGGGVPYGTPYPEANAGMPYPSTASTNPPYPSSGVPNAAPYPSSGGPNAAPYPSPGTASYPTGSTPNPASYAPAAANRSQYPAASTLAQGSSHHQASNASSASSTSTTTSPSKAAKSLDPDSTPYYECGKRPGDSGTVKPLKSGFNAETDATQLKNCLKSVSINETVIINILPHRSNAQRQKIRLMYKTMFGKDLLQDFRDRLSGDFESVTAGLLMRPAEYDAYIVNKAIEGAGTDEAALVEILCTRTNTQMRELGLAYKEIYKASIEQHMKDDSSGHFKRMLISLANGARQEDQGVNQQKAEEDAKKLYKAGAARLGTDESTFNSVFVSQSFEQLSAVFSAYQRLYKKEMIKVIKSEMSGDLEKGMKAIVLFTLDKHSYFANVLYKAMKGLGTDEKSLIRTLVTRSEIDLDQISKAFNNIKGESKPLSHWIKKETSGPFKDMLLHIIGGTH